MSGQTRNLLLGGLAVTITGAAGYFFFSNRGSSGAVSATTYEFRGACLACKQPVQTTQHFDENFPLKCPKCGQAAVYPWYYCYQCKKRFVPELDRSGSGPPRVPMGPRCTACGSDNVGLWVEKMTTQQPTGDATLPKWP